MRRVAASGRSRGGPAPYFQTKLWPERVKQYYFCFGDWALPLSKGLDDQPPPLISRSGSGTGCYVLSVRNLLALPPPRGDCSP